MDKREYIEKLTEQMRCKKARELVAREYEQHLEDQAEAFRYDGIEEQEAIRMAVTEMGDPVEVGVEMDRLHRPQLEWKLLTLIGILSVVGVIVQALLVKGSTDEIFNFLVGNHLIEVFVGILAMCLIYRMDYTMLEKWWSKILAFGILLLGIFTIIMGIRVNGSYQYLLLGFTNLNVVSLFYLYVPLYGASLYRYRGQGRRAVVAGIVEIVVPVALLRIMVATTEAGNICIILLVMFSFALLKGWFSVNGKAVAASIWLALIGSTVVVIIYILNAGADYQVKELKDAFTPFQYQEYYLPLDEYNEALEDQILLYPIRGEQEKGETVNTYNQVKELVRACKFIGRGEGMLAERSEYYSWTANHLLMFILYEYGVLPGLILMLLPICLVIKLFRVTFRQRNQLGNIVGFGCAMVLGVQTLQMLYLELTLMPNSGYLPLISSGRTGGLVTYVLVGIVLSIYRYKNIIPKEKRITYLKKEKQSA